VIEQAPSRAFVGPDRPFPGLRPFDTADCEFFFGREKQVRSLYRLLDLSRFVSVVGSSGSGKSSLVRAGLLPKLDRERAQSGGRPWRFFTMHPGDAPMRALREGIMQLQREVTGTPEGEDDAILHDRIELALTGSSFGIVDALRDIPELLDQRVMIVVDQFEELFRFGLGSATSATRAALRNEAVSFVQLLLEAARSPDAAVNVLITMRSDFIGDCANFQGLPEVVSGAQFLVPSLSRDQREDVIREPIRMADATVEPALVERLLTDGGNESDQLPVLQHCLARMWTLQQPTRRLDLDAYRRAGGIKDALSQHADEIMASPQLAGLERVVEQVFRALAERDRDGRETRRAIPFGQLVAETGCDPQDVRTVVDRFRADDCGFLLPPIAAEPRVADTTRVDVVHEALLRRWNRISDPETGWLTLEERDGRRYRALLTWLEAG